MSYKILLYLANRLDNLNAELSQGAAAWASGEDCCDMASCDPSDQYLIESEMEEIRSEIKDIVSNWQ